MGVFMKKKKVPITNGMIFIFFLTRKKIVRTITSDEITKRCYQPIIRRNKA